MRVLSSPERIKNALWDAMQQYRHYDWAVAWAGAGDTFDTLQLLIRHQLRIRHLIIGTHFFQTHPDFIERFRDHPGVRFNRNSTDLFHPKVYWFENSDDDWRCILGSANFTESAMSKNVEICMEFTSSDHGVRIIGHEIRAFIRRMHGDGQAVRGSAIDIDQYRKAWNKRRHIQASTPRIKKSIAINGTAGLEIGSSLGLYSLFDSSWSKYHSAIVHADRYPKYKSEYRDMLNEIRMIWMKRKSYYFMVDDERKKVVGLSGIYQFLGNMNPAIKFKMYWRENIRPLSRALDAIPLDRRSAVTSDHYKEFKVRWSKVREGGIGIASKLLTVMRPDVFCSVNSRSRDSLRSVLGLPEITVDNYWSECIEALHESRWWLSGKPHAAAQVHVWENRMAYLDILMAED